MEYRLAVTSFVVILAFTIGLNAHQEKTALFGECYDIVSPADLDLNRFVADVWYEIEKYENDFEGNVDCVTQTFVYNEGAAKILVMYDFVYPNSTEGYKQGTIDVTKGTDGKTLMVASFPEDSFKSNFSVLATDYDNYAVLYSCHLMRDTGSLPEKQERVWVLGKQGTLSEEVQEEVNNVFNSEGHQLEQFLYPTNQSCYI